MQWPLPFNRYLITDRVHSRRPARSQTSAVPLAILLSRAGHPPELCLFLNAGLSLLPLVVTFVWHNNPGILKTTLAKLSPLLLAPRPRVFQVLASRVPNVLWIGSSGASSARYRYSSLERKYCSAVGKFGHTVRWKAIDVISLEESEKYKVIATI